MSKVFTILFTFISIALFAQPSNDDCETAIILNDVADWCSGNGEFNNINANQSVYGTPSCWDNSDNDVWFRFTAKASTVSIIVSGSDSEGTIKNPMISIYDDNGCFGSLTGYTQCVKDNSNSNVVELNSGGLIVGLSYLVRVDAGQGSTGTFKLCIKNYFPPTKPGQDCATASLLCDKSPFVVENIEGIGEKSETDNTCIHTERHSTWFKWIAKSDGSLTFTLAPLQDIDDLDFVVYELPGGIDDCENRIVLRCNATYGGEHVSCGPNTGLNLTSTDLEEDSGCDPGEDGFLKFLDMKKGKTYALVVNNFSPSNFGFSIEFGGSGEFEGPEPDFIFDPPTGIRCEDSITAIDKTTYSLGKVVSHYWTFGKDAIPQISNKKKPSKIFYDSYGWKYVTLTVKSDKGCVSTITKDIWMAPCCGDIPLDERLKIVINSVENPLCQGTKTGAIKVSGLRGDPVYRFSIQDTMFNYNSLFNNLAAGKYKIYTVDKKGCRDSTIVELIDPDPLIADAGPDKTIELGDFTTLEGDYSPPSFDVSHYWTPNYNLSDSSDFKPDANPYWTTKYTLNVVQDETGCSATDEMTVFVNKNRLVRIPNVFTPNGDGKNDFFTAYNIKAGIKIDEMFIFDRWGELLYNEKDLKLGNELRGWDGRFKGQKVTSGVYVYLFMIEFLDGEILPFSGDITVLN